MKARNENLPPEHTPVLVQNLAERISLPVDAVVIDATIGYGGHSLLFGKMLGPRGVILGLDVDQKCIDKARERLAVLACKVIMVRENFTQIAEVAQEHGIEKVDLILADLGFCSAQLGDPRKGLSFQENMPLDMRLDDRSETTAADIVNKLDEKQLADLIYKFGQDRASRRIARSIVWHRQKREIATTAQLAAIVCKALNRPVKKTRTRIHPATRTFQALRIAVNNELENLKRLLVAAPDLLKRQGTVAVISFHSLEDKIVKDNFRERKLEGVYEIMTKKPLLASRAEIAQNRRARSAKLRIAERR